MSSSSSSSSAASSAASSSAASSAAASSAAASTSSSSAAASTSSSAAAASTSSSAAASTSSAAEWLNQVIPANYIPKYKKYPLRTLTVGAVILELAYAGFLAIADKNSVVDLMNMLFGKNVFSESEIIGIYVGMSPGVIADLLCNITSVSPISEADSLALSGLKKMSVIAAITILIAIVTSFPIGAAADAIPIIALLKSQLSDDWVGMLVKSGITGLVTLLGVTYYAMFTNGSIIRVSEAFSNAIRHPKDFAKMFWKDLAANLVITETAIANSAYRALAFGAIFLSVAQEIFGAEVGNPWVNAASIATIGTTALVTLLSRTLRVRDNILNPDFSILEPDEITAASVKHASLAFDVPMSLGHAAGAGLLAYGLVSQYIAPNNPWAAYVSGGVSAAAYGALKLYVAFCTAKKNNALATLGQQGIASRKAAIAAVSASAAVMSSTLSNLPKPEKITYAEAKEAAAIVSKIVEDIQEGRTQSKALRFFILIANILARVSRFFSFPDFVVMVTTQTFGLQLSYPIIYGICALWGLSVVKADQAMFAGGMQEELTKFLMRMDAAQAEEAIKKNITDTESGAVNAISEPPSLTDESRSLLKNTNTSRMGKVTAFFSAMFRSEHGFSGQTWGSVKHPTQQPAPR